MTFLKYIFRFRIVRVIVLAPIVLPVILLLDYLIGYEALVTGWNLYAIATWLIAIIAILFWIFRKVKQHRELKQEKQQFTKTLTKRKGK